MKSLDEKMTEKYPDGFTQEDIKYAELDNVQGGRDQLYIGYDRI